jgi:hypothetical protein
MMSAQWPGGGNNFEKTNNPENVCPGLKTAENPALD